MATKKKMLQAAAGVSTGIEGAWDLSTALADPSSPWDILGSKYTSVRNAGEFTSDVTGIFFKPDGLKMYLAVSGTGRIYEYNLSQPFNMATETYVQEATITDPRGIFFKDDGLKLYNVTNNGDKVEEYDLSTAWDISTRSLNGSKSVAAQTTDCRGMYISPNGTKMYVCGYNDREVYEYDLSTAWDVTSATHLQTLYQSSYFFYATGIFFKPDGTKMFVLREWDGSRSRLYEFSLSTAWDISTASYTTNSIMGAGNPRMYSLYMTPVGDGYFTGATAKSWQHIMGYFSVAAQETVPNGISFKPEGDKMYVVGSTGDDVNEYDLGQIPPFSVASNPNGVFFKSDGTKMYILGQDGQDVNEYDLSTAWGVSTAVYLQNFSVASQETIPEGIFFKPDGTKMYVTGQNGDDVNEYNLSAAWDISTSVYSQNFSVASQQTLPTGIFFKPEGTKMYVTGSQGNDDVTEYNLSTPWDISTSVFLQNFSVAAQETNPEGVFFKPDGTKMYVIGVIGDNVNEYDLSTPWDISTSVYLQNFSVAAQETNPTGLFFKPDGTKMYVPGHIGDDINEYDLSTPWDISTAAPAVDPETFFDLSTAVFVQSFSVAAQETNPQSVTFKPDGTKMYVVGLTGDAVNEYDLSTAWNISTASFIQNFSTISQETSPASVRFKADGTKMYIIGYTGDAVFEYNLSTAWDISSASYSQSFSTASQEAAASDLFFKPDGKKMFVLGTSGLDANEYDLSTAWDVTSASFVQNFGVSAQSIYPYGFFFKPDGTKMYIIDAYSSQMVITYSLGVQD